MRELAKLVGANPSCVLQHLDVMRACGIETALLSHAAPGVYFGDQAEAKALARACNVSRLLLTVLLPCSACPANADAPS